MSLVSVIELLSSFYLSSDWPPFTHSPKSTVRWHSIPSCFHSKWMEMGTRFSSGDMICFRLSSNSMVLFVRFVVTVNIWSILVKDVFIWPPETTGQKQLLIIPPLFLLLRISLPSALPRVHIPHTTTPPYIVLYINSLVLKCI